MCMIDILTAHLAAVGYDDHLIAIQWQGMPYKMTLGSFNQCETITT